MSEKVRISEDELLAEYARLDAMRVQDTKPLMTDEQFVLVQYGRENEPAVPWPKLRDYWESRGWGPIPLTTLKGRYEREAQRRNRGRE